MRIRKNRTSSRVTPEFCVTHAVEKKVENIKHVDAAKIEPPLQEPSVPIRNQLLDVDELELDAAAILNSLDNESSSYKIKIRDFVLAHGRNGRSGRSENHNCPTRPPLSGSESDTPPATGSRKRIARQHGGGNHPTSASTLSDKINSDTSSKAMGEEIESAREQDQTIAKFDVNDDHSPKPQTTTTTTTLVVDSGYSKIVFGSRKRHRRHVESDSRLVQDKEISMSKSEEEDFKVPATVAAAVAAAPPKAAIAERTARKLVGKEETLQQQEEKESAEKSPPSSNFPAGWSYRGLAQIAEHDKATQGKQCGRTDGRSWRCPLKVQEGFTLCEHHLSKFRLKKLCKGNKKQKSSAQQYRQPQPQQQPPPPPQSPPSPPPPSPSPPPSPEMEMSKTAQTSTTVEHDGPMKFRRRHKTVKLSVL